MIILHIFEKYDNNYNLKYFLLRNILKYIFFIFLKIIFNIITIK